MRAAVLEGVDDLRVVGLGGIGISIAGRADRRRFPGLDVEGMVTSKRPLDEIGDAFADMKASKGLRTVLDLA